jgi:hypothetical protein
LTSLLSPRGGFAKPWRAGARIGGSGLFDGIFVTSVVATAPGKPGLFSQSYQEVTDLWRICHIAPETPVEGQSQVDSCRSESYSPVIVIGGGVARVAYGVAPQNGDEKNDESLA